MKSQASWKSILRVSGLAVLAFQIAHCAGANGSSIESEAKQETAAELTESQAPISLTGAALTCSAVITDSETGYGEYSCNIIDSKGVRIYPQILRARLKTQWDLVLDGQTYKNPENISSESSSDMHWLVPDEILETPKRLFPSVTLRDVEQRVIGTIVKSRE